MQKKIIAISIIMILFSAKIFSDNDAPPLTNPPAKPWKSLNPQDTITFENASGKELLIEITADDDQTVHGVTGIVVYNCDDDKTKHYVKAGSSISCLTHDPDNPVKLESDRAGKSASGTVTIRTR